MTTMPRPASSHDVIIIGGGVAGCVLATRLSEDGRSVCLVEAGPDFGTSNQAWPQKIQDARTLPRDDVWEADSAPYRIRAKVLGGSSCINGCWHTWGSPEDYAEWERIGGPEWSAAGLEPFRQTAARQMRLRSVPEDELSVWSSASLVAAAELGYREDKDMAAPGVGRGYGCPPVNAIGDLRWNVAFAYLQPARTRENLRVLSDATAHRIIVRAGAVQGIEVQVDGQRTTLTADTYLLSAGTYGSPALLLRSGIGPANQLSDMGITPQVDLPGVGANLVDHPGVTLSLRPTDELNAALAKQEATGKLYPSQVALKAGSEFCPEGSWDLHLLPTAGEPLFGTLPPGQYEVGISAFVMKPRARGVLRLRSADPTVPVDIDPALLSDPEGVDLAMARRGLELAGTWARSSALAAWATPSDSRPPEELTDHELRARAGTYWHPVGTCAMGPDHDPHAVVDAEGRVRGVGNLRVIDASVLPTVPAANTQLSVLAVAEMLAEKLSRP